MALGVPSQLVLLLADSGEVPVGEKSTTINSNIILAFSQETVNSDGVRNKNVL